MAYWSGKRIRLAVITSGVVLIASNLVLFHPATRDGQTKGRFAPWQSVTQDRPSGNQAWRLYDPDPEQIWNRLYRSLYQRTARDGRQYGYDELDPLLWPNTPYLLRGSAYQQATQGLDQFLSKRAERLITDPLKRAVLQRDLWAVFDWTTQATGNAPGKLQLQKKLVQVMKRLALTQAQIASLPDNYRDAVAAGQFPVHYDVNRPQEAFLPPDLFDPNGPWVRLSVRGGAVITPLHVQALSGRSVFHVFIRLPGGREATIKYLTALSLFPQNWVADPGATRRLLTNPDLPQFPTGTQLALVRQMVVIDNQGNYAPTGITEQLQIRVHRSIPNDIPGALNTDRNEAQAALNVYEFRFSRPRLFGGASGGLRAIQAGETEFPIFQSHGVDLFEDRFQYPLERSLRVVLQACASCHFRPGIHAVLSRDQGALIPSWSLNYSRDATSWWKRSQYNWGLLQGLWQSEPAVPERSQSR
jgi:hypothetical protein